VAKELMNNLLTWILANQTIAVGVLGFAGVIITLLVNARLARRGREEKRRHERQALRAALVEELKINRESLTNNVSNIRRKIDEGSGKESYFVPADPMNDAYRAFTNRIGLLSQTEVRHAMFAYLSLQTSRSKLFLIGVPIETDSGHVKVPPENGTMLLRLLESTIEPIDVAIEALENVHDAD
jgi:hypothetical protein